MIEGSDQRMEAQLWYFDQLHQFMGQILDTLVIFSLSSIALVAILIVKNFPTLYDLQVLYDSLVIVISFRIWGQSG